MSGELGVDAQPVHQPENLLVVHLLSIPCPQLFRYLPVSVSPLRAQPYRLYLLQQTLVLGRLGPSGGLPCVFVRGLAQPRDDEPFPESDASSESLALAEFVDDPCLVDVPDPFLVSAKACSFFLYSISAF